MDAVNSPATETWWTRLRNWATAHPRLTLTICTLLFLAPFLAKPFNVDDPLFVWAGKQIAKHPFDPYDFNVNWTGTPVPMWRVTQNPPLACYYIAAVGSIFGWSEVALHTAFLLPALAVVLGTYRLARRFCTYSGMAALAVLFSPVFMVSSISVMCDVMMLAFWVWAVVFWLEGTFGKLLLAGLLIALSALSKYFGACLIPLLAVYAVFSGRHRSRQLLALLVSIILLALYQFAVRHLYHENPLWKAADYASGRSIFLAGQTGRAGMIAMAFLGGGMSLITFLTPWLWPRRCVLLLAAGGLLGSVLLFTTHFWPKYARLNQSLHFPAELQFTFWAIGGLSVVYLTAKAMRRSWLLGLWVAGTLIFTVVCNWTINGRSLLPIAPALAILIMQRAELRNIRIKIIAIALALSGALSFAVAQADFSWASATRQSAYQIKKLFGSKEQMVWFQGHWGFQYYMMEMGESPLDKLNPQGKPDDFLAVPMNNTSTSLPSGEGSVLEEIGPEYLSVMDRATGAGFYTSNEGPLPFSFAPVPPETTMIYPWSSKWHEQTDKLREGVSHP